MLPTRLTNMNHHDYYIVDYRLIYVDFIPQTSLFDIVEYSRDFCLFLESFLDF